MDIVLSKSTWPIIGWVCQILGWLINGIYFCLEKIGIPNIGIAIILYTIIIYLVLTPLQIKQQKMSKMMSVMQPDLQRIEKKYQNKKDQASQMKKSEETMAVYQKYGVSPTEAAVHCWFRCRFCLRCTRLSIIFRDISEVSAMYSRD